MLDPYKIREDFPILKREINGHPLIYFDNAATTQKPKQVIAAIREFYENCNANVHRAIHTLSQESSELYEEAHEEVARFINAEGMEEIIFVRGTTEAINLIAYAMSFQGLAKGDRVLVTLMEHHSNIVPWEILSEAVGFETEYVDVDKDGALQFQSLEDAISAQTKMLCMSHVSNVTGAINDVKRATEIAHEHGVMVLVDAAQSVPHLPVDVKDLDVDFLAFSGHKMLGPTGTGALYGRRELLERMKPFQGGGSMIKNVRFNETSRRCSISFNDLPWKFEAGTPDICGGVGLTAAIRYLKDIGMENVREHEIRLAEHAMRLIKECTKVKIQGPEDTSRRCGIIPFNMEGLSSHDVALFMDSYGIMIRSGFHCAQPFHERLQLEPTARASFYIYNTCEEIDRFCEVLKEIENL